MAPRYYGGNDGMLLSMAALHSAGCRVLVGGRVKNASAGDQNGGAAGTSKFLTLADLAMPADLQKLVRISTSACVQIWRVGASNQSFFTSHCDYVRGLACRACSRTFQRATSGWTSLRHNCAKQQSMGLRNESCHIEWICSLQPLYRFVLLRFNSMPNCWSKNCLEQSHTIQSSHTARPHSPHKTRTAMYTPN